MLPLRRDGLILGLPHLWRCGRRRDHATALARGGRSGRAKRRARVTCGRGRLSRKKPHARCAFARVCVSVCVNAGKKIEGRRCVLARHQNSIACGSNERMSLRERFEDILAAREPATSLIAPAERAADPVPSEASLDPDVVRVVDAPPQSSSRLFFLGCVLMILVVGYFVWQYMRSSDSSPPDLDELPDQPDQDDKPAKKMKSTFIVPKKPPID